MTADAVVAMFNQLFQEPEGTVLVSGAVEPFYSPGHPNQVFFRADYVRSALHEAAHWCVAGRCRRALPDYGYWYTPDGRSAERQAAFFSVEASLKPLSPYSVRRWAWRLPPAPIT